MTTVATDREWGEFGAVALGTVAGVVLVGGGLRVGVGSGDLERIGTLAGLGTGTLPVWVGVLVASIVATVAFGPFLARATDPFVSQLFSLTQKSDRLRTVLLPVVTNHAYVATAVSLGLTYGIVLGVVVGGVAVPLVLSAAGGGVSLPAIVLGVVAWTVYGVVVGGIYAVLTDKS